MSVCGPQVFISYSEEDEFEAGLLKFALETLLEDKNVMAWTYQRDQSRSEGFVRVTIALAHCGYEQQQALVPSTPLPS